MAIDLWPLECTLFFCHGGVVCSGLSENCARDGQFGVTICLKRLSGGEVRPFPQTSVCQKMNALATLMRQLELPIGALRFDTHVETFKFASIKAVEIGELAKI